jgi:hypothetical protein
MMKSLSTQHNFTKGLLLAAVVFSIAPTTEVITSSAILGQQYPSLALAQEELGVTDTATTTNATTTDSATGTTTTEDTTKATTTTGGGSSNKLAGIIASLQPAPYRPVLEWVAAGYWELESDMPLLGRTTEPEPTVNRFDAVVEMTRLVDGTFLHSHTFSDFRQSDILSVEGNTTTINGTMTVVDAGGTTENVPVYITLQNNLISIAVDPVATGSHFGPTPITGIILAPEQLQQISNLLTPTAEEGGGAGTETTRGQQ